MVSYERGTTVACWANGSNVCRVLTAEGTGRYVAGTAFILDGTLYILAHVRGTPLRDWCFIAEQPAPAPHLAHPGKCAALRILLVTVPCVSCSCEHFLFPGSIRSQPAIIYEGKHNHYLLIHPPPPQAPSCWRSRVRGAPRCPQTPLWREPSERCAAFFEGLFGNGIESFVRWAHVCWARGGPIIRHFFRNACASSRATQTLNPQPSTLNP